MSLTREIILKRLAFAKFLIEKGNEESKKPEPLSSVALLHYHDALELAFLLVLEDKDINSNNLSFMQYFDKINDWINDNPPKVEISSRPSLDKLKRKRVNLKHHGIFSSKTDVQESRIIANNIFEELCKNVYNLDVKDISLINLVFNSKVRSYLEKAKSEFSSNKNESIKALSLAFEFLLKDYESSKRTRFGESPFFFGKDMTWLNSFNIRNNFIPNLNNENQVFDVDRLSEFIDKVKESIESMQKAVKILAFGLDYRKFIKFSLIIPKPVWAIGSPEPIFHMPSTEITFNKEDLDFCINYIIECALKLQEFDFELTRSEET